MPDGTGVRSGDLLVAVDFSPCSTVAVNYAGCVANQLEATLVICHVSLEADELSLVDARRRLEQLRVRSTASSSALLVVAGDPLDVLPAMISSGACRLVFLGQSGLSGALLLGTTVARAVWKSARLYIAEMITSTDLLAVAGCSTARGVVGMCRRDLSSALLRPHRATDAQLSQMRRSFSTSLPLTLPVQRDARNRAPRWPGSAPSDWP